PGTDHAGIATQNVVERKLASEGKSRHDFSRAAFLAKVWEWKEAHGSTIIRQLKRLGCACDWPRERFTMDDGYSEAVREIFIRLYEQGLIYRGNYIINWCPRCATALSDEEAPHVETDGYLYHIRYPLKNSPQYLIVATTRPETMLGDTAVAVNPQDERYRAFIGKTVVLPLVGREIPVIADAFVDPKFGTGAVKVTPAHDPNDYGMGKRHNLPFITIFHPDGRCNEHAGEYAGQDRFEAREAVIEDLRESRLLEKIEPHHHAVGHCYRCHSVVEPYLSKQWFVKMKPLSLPAIEAVKNGSIRFHPERWTKVYLNWMENIQDWCISRQIWWGHRLPVYYCQDCLPPDGAAGDLSRQGIIVGRDKPAACPQCGSPRIVQDDDVLDTWFSSWLWPFATFGWPFANLPAPAAAARQADLEYFYPTATLVTAPEIIFFWVARMIMAGLHFQGKIPFRDVYIHGTVRDETGKKMSKSLGNIIDPLEIIDDFGADALRFSIISLTAMGQDVFLSKEKFEFGRNFANKIWNAARFIMLKVPAAAFQAALPRPETLPRAERWIVSRFSSTLEKINEALQKYRFNEAAGLLYDFVWHEFCDRYIELAKSSAALTVTHTVLAVLLERILRIAHPFMPFLTEELWLKVNPQGGFLLQAGWPAPPDGYIDLPTEERMQFLWDVVTAIRTLRCENNIKPRQEVEISIFADDPRKNTILSEDAAYVRNLARVSSAAILGRRQPPEQCVSSIAAGCEIFLHSAGAIDPAAEIKKLDEQIALAEKEICRKETLLAKDGFVAKAPAAVVEKERSSLAALRDEVRKLRAARELFE
ncbi:MAG: valine--tRNA ligase, partial [Candidatus Omnitrophica bacterium]|nr:valine--tRNA ligase [Candidatus Omnitrophota bacterium]